MTTAMVLVTVSGGGEEEKEAPGESFDALFEVSSRQQSLSPGNGGGQLLSEGRDLFPDGGCFCAGLLQLLLQLLHCDPECEWKGVKIE